MSAVQKVKLLIAVLVLLAIALFLHYNLPHTAVVQITGTDVKRADRTSGGFVNKDTGKSDSGNPLQTYDVRFINTLSRNGKTMVFRNEDTGWGWPPYFKFNSADLTAQAQSFATDPSKPWVLVKYYGWRIHIFSMFPNVVNLKLVDRDYTHFPVFNILVILLLAAAVAVGFFKLRGWRERRRGAKSV